MKLKVRDSNVNNILKVGTPVSIYSDGSARIRIIDTTSYTIVLELEGFVTEYGMYDDQTDLKIIGYANKYAMNNLQSVTSDMIKVWITLE